MPCRIFVFICNWFLGKGAPPPVASFCYPRPRTSIPSPSPPLSHPSWQSLLPPFPTLPGRRSRATAPGGEPRPRMWPLLITCQRFLGAPPARPLPVPVARLSHPKPCPVPPPPLHPPPFILRVHFPTEKYDPPRLAANPPGRARAPAVSCQAAGRVVRRPRA